GPYSEGAVSDPTGPSTCTPVKRNSETTNVCFHVVRSGSWGSSSQDARISVRTFVVPKDQGGSSIGFRVVREAISSARLTSKTIQGVVAGDGAIPEFEIQFVPTQAGDATHVVKVSGREFSVLLWEGREYRVRISGLPKGYSGAAFAGPLDL